MPQSARSKDNEDENSHAPSNEQTADLLARAAMKGPIWVRALALLALILTTATPYTQRFFEYLDDRQADAIARSVNTPLTDEGIYKSGGTPIAAPKDSPVLIANSLSPEDALHLSWHNATKMESPAFKRLLVSGRKGIIAYSVYPSDGCILINHILGNHLKSDLVRAEEHTGKDTKALNEPFPEIDWDQPRIKLDIAWQPQTSEVERTTDKTPVQGSCMNPHPGQFNYWTVPIDQCGEQVFRRFADGCTHYQLHNRCNNAWEPGVHWTFCNAQHAW